MDHLLDMDKELQNLINSIEKSDYEDYPYEYLHAVNLFSDEFYNDILNHLPPDERFFHLMHPDAILDRERKISSRLHIDTQKLSGPLWKRVNDILQSKELKSTLLDRFRKTVRTSECSITSYLSRDKKQYKISPHPDTTLKIISVIIYLPNDNSHENLGTNILFEDFKLFKKVKFHRNSGIAFPVNSNSFHSVDPTPYEGKYDRNSLQCFYYGR
jgi:hypothetical protein